MKKITGVFLLGLGLWLSVFLGPAQAARNMLQIKGSDTLINLVQRLAEVYMEKNPGNYIAVTGGGSGTGIAAIINQTCDIANASRLMKPQEREQARQAGVKARRVVIAMDGLSVITHPDNPVDRLTFGQIGAIFRGEITNWRQVGGPDQAITLYGRQSNSGTFVFFRDKVLQGDYSQKMNRMNGNAQIVEAVKKDPSAIGYVGVGYVKNTPELTVVSVAAQEGGPYISPLNASDVATGKYPLLRPLNQYIRDNTNDVLKQFIDFELSPQGQKIVEEEGFFPIPPTYQQPEESTTL